ncbi:TPA: toprim domain-containing protein [Klebsiella oxytoca]
MSYYKADTVREAANGNWLFILAALAPHLEPALRKPGRHVSCPIHGGKDGFRLFKDAHLTGGGVCNTCGANHDGFELLMWLNNWDFKQCLSEVGDYLGVEKEQPQYQQAAAPTRAPVQAKAPVQQEPMKVNNKVLDSKNRKKSIAGTLIAHGKAPYEHNEDNELSYFAFIRDKSGLERTIWGVDLERAIGESEAKYGDEIVMTNLGREPVTVVVEVKDEQGNVVREQPMQTHRNTWLVERRGATVTQFRARSNGGVEPVSHHVESAPVVNRTVEAPAPQVQHAATQPEEQSSENKPKVVPMFREQPKPWLLEIQEEMEKRMERERAYSARLREKIEKVWNECLPFSSHVTEPMRLYFKNRELLFKVDEVEKTDCLRFNPAMAYYDEDGNEVGKFPAIVCAIRDVEGNLVTLHRTYLTQNGKKAKVGNAKKMMPIPDGLDVNGAAIRLGEPTEGILGVAEGLETALSAYRVTQIPVWSTVNATLMESFEVPEGVHTVLIWADKDKSVTGEKSANVLKAKLEKRGIRVYVLLPKLPIPPRAKGIDWNDVLMSQGSLGFPNARYLRDFIARRRAEYGRH